MEKVAPNSKFVGHSTEIIQKINIKGLLLEFASLYLTQDLLSPAALTGIWPLKKGG